MCHGHVPCLYACTIISQDPCHFLVNTTENTAVQRLWEHATTVEDIQRATDLHQRCWLQRGVHGQHKPFSEELSATAFNVRPVLCWVI